MTDKMKKCEDCNEGIVELFTSRRPCEVCGGTGQVPSVESSRQNSNGKLPTGFEVLDKLTKGGFPLGEVTTISGPERNIQAKISQEVLRACVENCYSVAYVNMHDHFKVSDLNLSEPNSINQYKYEIFYSGSYALDFVLKRMSENTDIIIINSIPRMGTDSQNITQCRKFHKNFLREVNDQYATGSKSAILAFDQYMTNAATGVPTSFSVCGSGWERLPALRIFLDKSEVLPSVVALGVRKLPVEVIKSRHFKAGGLDSLRVVCD